MEVALSGLTKPLPMYRNIFNNARYYSAAAALLYENVVSGKRSADYAPGGILCGTFCIELLLKCLILIEHDDIFTKQDVTAKGIKLDNHSYSELFRKGRSEQLPRCRRQ
jgi:hypothetical protein